MGERIDTEHQRFYVSTDGTTWAVLDEYQEGPAAVFSNRITAHEAAFLLNSRYEHPACAPAIDRIELRVPPQPRV